MEHWLIQYFWIFFVIEFLDHLKFCTVLRPLLNFLGHFWICSYLGRSWIFWTAWILYCTQDTFEFSRPLFEFFRRLWILDHLKFLQFLSIFAVLALVAGPRLHTCWIVTALVIWLHFHSMMFTLARWRNHYFVNSEIDYDDPTCTYWLSLVSKSYSLWGSYQNFGP